MMRRFLYSLMALLTGVLTIVAQKPSVKSFTKGNETDLSGYTMSRKTSDGNYCALIRIRVPNANLSVSGLNEGNITVKDNAYLVYMNTNATWLKLTVQGYLPVMIDFSDYEGILPLKPKSVYDLRVELPVLNSSADDRANLAEAQEYMGNGHYESALLSLLKIRNRTPLTLKLMADCYLGLPSKRAPDDAYTRYKKLYSEAAELGEPSACWSVATDYERENNWEEALYWWRKGAYGGDSNCMSHLGYIHSGQSDYPDKYTNKEESFQWYTMAAETDDNDYISQYRVGEHYYFGVSGSPDYDKAFYWLSKSAAQDCAEALCLLGICYTTGHGTKQNPAEAYRCHIKAAEQNHAVSMEYIGCMYLTGSYLEKNQQKGLQYITDAAKLGSPWAQYFLGECHREGTLGLEQDNTKCFKYLMGSVFSSLGQYEIYACDEAFYAIGKCYEEGIGTEKDMSKAKAYYRTAAQTGIPEAAEALERLAGQEH